MPRLALNAIDRSRLLREQAAVGLFLHAHPELDHLPHEKDVCLNWFDALSDAYEHIPCVSLEDREIWAAIGVDASCVPVDVAIRENSVAGLVTGIAMEDIVDEMVIRGQTLTHREEDAYPMLRHLTVDDGVAWSKGL